VTARRGPDCEREQSAWIASQPIPLKPGIVQDRPDSGAGVRSLFLSPASPRFLEIAGLPTANGFAHSPLVPVQCFSTTDPFHEKLF
jgi:hypothetical protein